MRPMGFEAAMTDDSSPEFQALVPTGPVSRAHHSGREMQHCWPGVLGRKSSFHTREYLARPPAAGEGGDRRCSTS